MFIHYVFIAETLQWSKKISKEVALIKSCKLTKKLVNTILKSYYGALSYCNMTYLSKQIIFFLQLVQKKLTQNEKIEINGILLKLGFNTIKQNIQLNNEEQKDIEMEDRDIINLDQNNDDNNDNSNDNNDNSNDNNNNNNYNALNHSLNINVMNNNDKDVNIRNDMDISNINFNYDNNLDNIDISDHEDNNKIINFNDIEEQCISNNSTNRLRLCRPMKRKRNEDQRIKTVRRKLNNNNAITILPFKNKKCFIM